MKPVLSELVKITAEQTSFDKRIAIEVMGWTQLDDALIEDFSKHTLPDRVYPFFETTSRKGILMYHPTPYHQQMYCPSICAEDDIAAFISLLGKQPEVLGSTLSILHFIHHQRAIQDAGFQPNDEYYRIAKYYKPGDLSTLALHLIERKEHAENEKASQITKVLGKQHIGSHGIDEISFNSGILTVKCKDKSSVPPDVLEDFNSHGLRVEWLKTA